MKNEQILLCEGGGNNERLCAVAEIVIPDIRFQGLFVSREEQALIEFAYESACNVREMILRREREASHREKFTIDIPDLWFITTQTIEVKKQHHTLTMPAMRREMKEEITIFSSTFLALVEHFLPRAKRTPYSYDGKTQHGVKYQGYAWVSDDR